jgi:tetratricopeptide (TPR) repeat protein
MINQSRTWPTLVALVGLLLSISAVSGWCGDDGKSAPIAIDGHIHTTQEILKLMDQSVIVYQLGSISDASEYTTEQDSLNNSLSTERYVIQVDGHPSVRLFDMSGTLAAMLASADSAYQKREYDRAILEYRKVYDQFPDYHRMLVFIGDGFYGAEQYDSAAFYFQEALDKNFIDYQAHWFLADALWELDRQTEATRELALAHILNRNHQVLLHHLKNRREVSDRDWKEWSFGPLYSVHRDAVDSHLVIISCDTAWIGYALVKALWQFEPGYSKKMLGHDLEEGAFNLLEEREALACQLSSKKDPGVLGQIIKSGFTTEFIIYEILARQHPEAMASISTELLGRIADYVEKFH